MGDPDKAEAVGDEEVDKESGDVTGEVGEEEDGEDGEEEDGEEGAEEGEFLQDDIGQVYSLPEAELVRLCKEMELDEAGSQHELASRVLDKMEEEIAADPSAPGPRGIGCMRNERLRGSLQDWEERVNEAEGLKDAANVQFKAGANEVALAAYMAAVWLLKPDNPLSPDALGAAIWQVRAEHPLCPGHADYLPHCMLIASLIACRSELSIRSARRHSPSRCRRRAASKACGCWAKGCPSWRMSWRM